MELPETTSGITAEWLNRALHENGYLSDSNIVSLEHQPIGAGEGFNSDMALLRVGYDRNDANLPSIMVAKLPTTFEGMKKLTRLANFYEREIRFYLEVAPTSPIRVPGLIFGEINKEKDRYVLIVEDCSQYELADPSMTGLDYETAKSVILNMADFHAWWWDADFSAFPWMPQKHIDIGGELFRKCWESCIRKDEFIQALPPGGLEAGARIYDQYAWILDNIPSNKLTIQHNDLKSDNIFIDRRNKDNPAIIFDWAMAVIERGAGDAAFLLGTSMSVQGRRENDKELIREYHSRLMANGISDYTFQECWSDYLMGLIFKTYIPVIAFARVDLSNSRSIQIWNLMINRLYSGIVDNDATSILP